jgi:hypothetical protein
MGAAEKTKRHHNADGKEAAEKTKRATTQTEKQLDFPIKIIKRRQQESMKAGGCKSPLDEHHGLCEGYKRTSGSRKRSSPDFALHLGWLEALLKFARMANFCT